ncbi:MAG: flagellar basal body rod protein FlgB [Granulosicoccus sp.]|nr:flagellar basal body rod protein FlgB [Granulosicoccus sp.]
MASIDNYLAVHANAIKLRSKRAELIAGNLANADTPGYRPRDINFAAAMKAATSVGSAQMSTTHSKHIPLRSHAAGTRTLYRDSPQGSLDENSVDSELERTKFADNDVRYQASVQFISGRVNSLLRALRGE